MTDFDKYFKSLQSHKIGDITEHSHRPALKELMESLAGAKVKILHEPKREGKFGSPDFKITHTESIIGYVENKKIEENLDKTIKSDQIKKYQSLSDNILITNYIDWIWMKEGKIQQRETLCFLTDIENKRAKLDKTKVDAVEKLIKSFLSQAPKEIGDAKKLAEALAVRAKLLKDFLLDELKRQGAEHTEGRLYQLYETFKTFVFHELTVDEFSDAFAQNLVYGLFLAKLNADVHAVNLYNAKKYIPASFELIRELVNFLDELDNEEYRETRWIVEEVLTIMNNLDLRAIQDTLSFTKKRKDADNIIIKDPYVYFYEDFLAAYDKKLRKAKGVYYTPPPVVNFIVRAIDDILIKTFKIKEGLADRNKVTVLDFATGTGTFLLETLQQIFDKLPRDSGKKDLIIKEHILKNLFGFEYLIAPYTIAHLKLSQFLKDNGYQLKAKERLQVFLSNTLEPIPSQIKIPLLPALTEESKQAQEIKDKPILVITGNPPYSKKSKNNGDWIVNLVDSYKLIDGKRSKEKQNWYRDDYIKFIRFAQDKMDKVDEGIVAVITNHSFLSNITMPGMRQSLLNSFDQLYVINLHGSAKKEESLPDGFAKDENVFDIEQGVSMSFFIKKKGLPKKVFYADFWGSRKEKYQRSLNESIASIQWQELNPVTPNYFLIPRNEQHSNEYYNFFSVTKIFKVFSLPLMTGRDLVTIRRTKNEIKDVLKVFNEKTEDQIREVLKTGDDSRDWKISKAKSDITKTKNSDTLIKEVTYRLFDKRFTYYTGNSKGFHASPQFKVCKNMLYKNLGLLVPRQLSKTEFKHVFCTNSIPEMCAISTATKEQNQLFPLYVYINASVDNKPESVIKEENFTSDFRKYIEQLYGKGITAEEIFGCIYAILHSPSYRKKYIEFLKIEFARIPFPKDKKLFKQLAELGNELIQVHLMEEEADYSYGDFIGKGTNIVEKLNHVTDKKVGKLYINKTQYFTDVPLTIWNFHIGGYQVLDKYLKERKGRTLTIDEVDIITSTIKALAFTIDQMLKIDTLTKNWI